MTGCSYCIVYKVYVGEETVGSTWRAVEVSILLQILIDTDSSWPCGGLILKISLMESVL